MPARHWSLRPIYLVGGILTFLILACGVPEKPVQQPQGQTQMQLTYGANGYPYCTNGSNTGGGYGWDPRVVDPRGSHSCLVVSTGPNGYPYCMNGSNTGGGYGWDPDVTDPRGSHSCLVPTGAGKTPPSDTGQTPPPGSGQNPPPASGSLTPLSLGASGNASFKFGDYGATLRTNKAALAAAVDAAGGTKQEKALIIAIAMQETTHMLLSQRDASKDGTPSANVSFLNLNYDMLTKLGYTGRDWGQSLNTPDKLVVVVGYLLKGFRTWGYISTLNYIRGGYTAFKDGVSYGAGTYRNAIQTIYGQIAKDELLMRDSRRVEINVPWV